MRNISLSDFESRRISNIDNCEVFSYDSQSLYAYNKGIIVKVQENNEQVVCDLSKNLYPVTEKDDIPKALLITYCCEKELLYLILVNGDIVSVEVNVSDTETIVGSVDSGIKAAQWSPDQEVIAIVTGIDSVLVMTKDFDAVSEVNLHGNDFGEKQFITVGWGKKETQFRGSEGKFKSNQNHKEEVVIENSNQIRISWRGDAEYFAVSSIIPDTCQRYLRIFNKSGILQYTSENLNGLEHCLDWKPSGSAIASTQRLPNKYNVCFFEKNGLKHNEFSLPLSHDEIRVDEILWNKDSRILTLLITKILDNDSNSAQNKLKYIQLFTVGNYHWYCKYTIEFSSVATPILMQWNHQKNNTLHVVLLRDNFIYHNKYSWLWVTNKSQGSSLEDESFVAVIDGCNLQLTSFKRGIIPPPMCTYIIQLPMPINLVSFAPDGKDICSNDLFLQLCDGSLLIYKFLSSREDPKKIGHELVGKINSLNNDFEMCYKFQWVSEKIIMNCLVKVDKIESKPFLNILDIESFSSIISYKKKEMPLLSTVAILKASKNVVIVHDNDGHIYCYNGTDNELRDLYPNEKKTLVELEVRHKDNGDLNIFSLDNLNRFYINNKIVLVSVLSFHIHEKFIFFTDLKHDLRCINFEEISNISNLSEIFARRVERGSRLLTSVSKDMKVILQMPRGNLECIQPRALSLHVVGKYLDSLNYYEAFDLMRKQRVNLNLLYDHDPILFSKNLNTFIEQIKNPQWLNLFISELSNEDVTKTMYSVIYKNKLASTETETEESKIDRVCNLVEKAIENDTEKCEKYLLTILTCYIKRSKVEFLEAVLLKLKNLNENKKKKLAISFDEALAYVLYLIDVEELYKIALGMYDVELALLIAKKSQKDPKEYLSFLAFISNLDTSRREFVIDNHLKRYEKALKNLILTKDEDYISYMKKHNLFKVALKLIPQNTEGYKRACFCYADELMKSHLYEEAGIMYVEAGIYREAMEAFRKSGNWREVLSCGLELKLSENELNQLYAEVALDLCNLKHFKEAATIYLDYLNDVEECMTILSKGKMFAEAYRICNLHDRRDLISQLVVPAILEHGDLLKLQINNFSDTLIKQTNRLQVVRKKKLESSEIDFVADNDAYSESSTVITQSYAASHTTNRTYRSAKNKRKHERKLLSLKEGSPYEDLALVASLHNLVTNCIELKFEIQELNKFLIKIKRHEMAEKLQGDLDELLKRIESSKSEIWIPELLNNQYYGPSATSNEIAAMYMKSENVPPVLLNPKFAIPPETKDNVKWQLEILKPS